MDGPLYLATNVYLVISYSQFTRNSADFYGGVFQCKDSSLQIEHSEFRNNIANTGSVIYTAIITQHDTYTITIYNSTFINNFAHHQGTISSQKAKITITESKFIRNSAQDGGILASSSSDVLISNSFCYGNRVSGKGGVVYYLASKHDVLTIINSTFEMNLAGIYGAVLYSQDSFDIAIDSSMFIDNKAAFDHSISSQNCWSLRISHSHFSGMDDIPTQSYIYFTNTKRVDTVYRTYNTSFMVHNGNMSTIIWSADDDFQMITIDERWGPYLQSCQWGFNMGKLKLSQISYPVVFCQNGSLHTLYYITLPDIMPAGYLQAYCKCSCLLQDFSCKSIMLT